MKLKKISLRNAFEALTDSEMKATHGGYGDGGPCHYRCWITCNTYEEGITSNCPSWSDLDSRCSCGFAFWPV